MNNKTRGFTLIELIIVLAIIGLVATVILPALRRSMRSELMDGLNNITSQIKLAYDNAILTQTVHRMSFDLRKGIFWTEIAPTNFQGRAPVYTQQTETIHKEKIKLYEKLVDEAESADTVSTPILEIPVQKRSILSETSWKKPANNLIAEKKLEGNLIFVKITTNLSEQTFTHPVGMDKFSNKPSSEKEIAYVYFFPDGTTSEVSFQIGFQDQEGNIDTNALKYTLNLNPFTGQVKLLEGFQEPNFELPK